jgi:predicted Zn finger-like uncharacterized protein
MLTECPSCLTVFRVTGAILKMGHGQVRCGKCRTQFDALEALLDDDSGDDADNATKNSTTDSSQATTLRQDSTIEADESPIAEEITLEGSRIEISGTYRVAADGSSAQEGAQVFHEHVVIDRDEQRGETRTDRDDENSLREVPDEQIIDFTDDGEPVAEAAHHLLADANPVSSAESSTPLSQRIWKRAQKKITQQPTVSGESDEIVAELSALSTPTKAVTVRSSWWTAASVVLIITLAAQAIHHYRDPLVRNPKWGGTISRLYRILGASLTPQWDLHAYELQQWGVISDSAAKDALRVRASVTNTATYEQPYPHVRLALEDRWGAIVAMREFAPEEYLTSTAANRMMAPRQRANAEIVIVDPGADAVGFQIRACMPQGQGIVCSDDVPVSR